LHAHLTCSIDRSLGTAGSSNTDAKNSRPQSLII
jgi:hypothetical protein